MNILVIGLGSMGKRRIRLLGEHIDIEVWGIDSQESRCAEVLEKFNVKCFGSIREACAAGKIGAAFICTSPLSHADIIKECLENHLHVFTEINLVRNGYDENRALAEKNNRVLFLSSTFLYRKETTILIEKVQAAECPLNYIYHVGQYLSDWHPWENYSNYFIGDSRTNGCREIMAIDLPWIVTCFGDIRDVKVMKGKNTGLNIAYNDSYLILIEHVSGTKGVFAVDVVARKPYRHIDIYGEKLQLSWDGTAGSLRQYNIATGKEEPLVMDDASEHMEGYASFITENPYREEINAFLKLVAGGGHSPAWDFYKDEAVLRWIDQIEAS